MGNYNLHKEKIREFVSRRLLEINKSRVQLSDEIGKSLSYISQVESGAVNCSQELAEEYCKALCLDTSSRSEFLFRVNTSNALRKAKSSTDSGRSVSALISVAADMLNDDDIRKIEEIVYRSVSA